MKLSLICAMAENRIIGRNNSLPWHLSDDLKYFKNTTIGKIVIMGRKTWESIGRALPGRINIVITNNPDYEAEGAKVVRSLEEATKLAEKISLIDGNDEAFVIGGAGIYKEALPQAQRFHLTRIHAEILGDTCLARFNEDEWEEIAREEHIKNESNTHNYSICVLQRRS